MIMLHLRVAFFHLVEKIKVLLLYPSYRTTELLFSFLSLFSNPYAISKRFLREKGAADLYTYGETPLTTWDKIAKECGLFSTDCVFDLGCGRGKALFWLTQEVGCRAVGVEIIPTFILQAKRLQKWLRSDLVTFHHGDMREIDLTLATFIYIDGLFLDEILWKELLEKFSQLRKGTKIVTTSEPLPAPFCCVKEFEGRYAWGTTTLYLHQL